MTQNKSSLTDEAIVEIAQKIDQLILEVGEQYHPSGIEFASIALGRLMIFSKQDRKSTRLNSSHVKRSRMPSSA